jgi:predicted lipid-binding transport protein (Tim44 family)
LNAPTLVCRRVIAGLLALGMVAGLFARGGGGCLAAGTQIATPAGSVAIETLRPGDLIITVADGHRATTAVAALREVIPAEFVALETDQGTTLLATAEHPVAVAPGVFRRAGDLVAGAELTGVAGSCRLQHATRQPAERPAYDLLVSRGGVFFANGILVHNKGCFLPDTPVLLANGTRRAIREVATGDTVLAFDAAGAAVPARVQTVLQHEVDSYLVVRTGTVELRVTEEHPFFVGHGTFKTIGTLRVGDTVWAHDGAGRLAPQTLLAIERVKAHVTVYNLQTDEPHTYFADGLAVHNKGGGCFAAGTLVTTPAGPRPIETLQPGDTILARTADGTLVRAGVEGIYLNYATLLTLQTDHGALHTTAEHPLLDGTGSRFALAAEYGVGTTVARLDGPAQVLAIERGTEPVPVYTLAVDGPHTFLADGFVVHNKGGGGFHGSHRSSGYHSSGTGGGAADGGLFGVIVFLGFAMLIAVLIAKAKGQQDDGEELDYCFARPAIEGKAAKTRELLTFIGRVDDRWQPEKLQAFAREVFLKLQACWSRRDYTEMKPLMMADLFAQHEAQIRGLIQTHEINLLQDLDVLAVDLVHVEYTNAPAQRTFTALITARARDCYLDDRTKAFLRGDDAPATFQEFWTFQSGDGGFRLRDIEQTKESDVLTTENLFEQFTDTGRDQIYGKTAGQTGPAGPSLPLDVQDKDRKIERLLNFLVQTDRIWNRDEMIATARRVFLNVALGWQDGQPNAFAGAPLDAAMAEHLRAVNESNQRNGCRVEYRNLCVRKVEIVHVDNRDDRALDRYTARIAAHAQVIIARGSVEQRHDPDVRAWVEYWTFAREGQRWVLAEIQPAAEGASIIARENVDEGSSAQMLEWYYSKPRAT